jgi:hypothetical protein
VTRQQRTPRLTAIVVDHCRNDVVIERWLARVHDLVIERAMAARVSRAAVVVAVDGRQTEPIPLRPAPPAEGAESRLLQVLLAAARGPGGVVPKGDPAQAVTAQTEDLAAGVAFAVDALEPDAIVVVTDASIRLAAQDLQESLAGMPSPAEFLAHLHEEQCAPDLDRCAVSVVAPRQTWPSFDAYWQAICARSGSYERIEV